MNQYISILFAVCFFGVFSACNKESEGVVTHITTYADIVLKGKTAMTLPLNGTYTEPGYTANEGNTDITDQVAVTGEVNTLAAGVYTITYSVENSDGYPISKSRFVGVYEPGIELMDISGNYVRDTNGAEVKVTKTKDVGLYINNNPGGVPGTTTTLIYMFHSAPTVVGAPEQPSAEGDFACIDGSYDIVNLSFKWKCINSGYGAQERIFNKVN